MNINSLIQLFQTSASEILESYGLVNGSFINLKELENMGYDKFSLQAKMNMPLKLYKYFPNKLYNLKDHEPNKIIMDELTGKSKEINYSLQALQQNTVFMQSPSEFDDIYDSDISLNYKEYEKLRLTYYCNRCEVNIDHTMTTQEIGNSLVQYIWESYNSNRNFNFLIRKKFSSEKEKLSDEVFLLKLEQSIIKDKNWGIALSNVISSDFQEYSKSLQNIFRTTCFTTTPYSQLMWGGAYADCHRGFCLEYTVLPNDPQYENIYLNLFPMIYCKKRPNMTKRLAELQYKEISQNDLWNIYFHGALRKSFDWAYQNEWRLLLPMQNNGTAEDYTVPFFPITKVFLGNRMLQNQKREIIKICNRKNIPYVSVMRNPNIFEMQECPIKCENCPIAN